MNENQIQEQTEQMVKTDQMEQTEQTEHTEKAEITEKTEYTEKVEKPKFDTSYSERLTYGLYFFGQLIFFTFISSFLQLYMTDIGIPAMIVGGVLMAAKMWDAINDPLFGLVVDKARFKGGKYIPWVRFSSFFIPAATVLIFIVPPSVSVQVKAIWVAVAYMLWDTAYTMCDVPIQALATSMTNSLKERERIFMFKNVFTFVGAMATAVVVPLLYPEIGWTMTIIIVSIIGFITMLPVSFKARERFFNRSENEESPKIKELFLYVIRNRPLLVFFGAMVISAIAGVTSPLANYVAIHLLGGPHMISVVSLVSTLPMIAALPVVPSLIKRFDKYHIVVVSIGISICLGPVLYFVGYGNLLGFFVITAIRFFLTGIIALLFPMVTADCSEYGHFVTGKRAQGMAFSVQTFASKAIAALSASMGMFMLGAVGFIEGEGVIQSAYTLTWLWRLSTLIPLTTAIPYFLIILFLYNLRKPDVILMMKANNGEISREEALEGLSDKLKYIKK